MVQSLSIRQQLALVANNYEMFGARETLRQALRFLLRDSPRDDFDDRYDLSTAQSLEVSDAAIDNPVARANAILYVPTLEPVMRHILRSASTRFLFDKTSFVDFGCGKGRALILAAQLPFQEVIGVEVSPVLSRVASANVSKYLAHPTVEPKCRKVRVECVSALDFEFPDTDLFIYMYRPFVGRVFTGVADRMLEFCATKGRRIWLALSCPDEGVLLEQHGGFVKREEFLVISSEYSWTLWECVPRVQQVVRAAGSSTAPARSLNA